MRVNLYRRHKPNCVGGHQWQSRSSELEERRKGWRRCECLIHFSATIGGRFGRKSTTTADWDESRCYAVGLAAGGNWNGAVVPPRPQPESPAAPVRVTLAEAISVFLANREATVAPPTFRKYKTFTKQLHAFADSRGYVMLDQFRSADIDIFYTTSTLGPRSKAKMLERLRGFFRFGVNRDWIPKSPVSPDVRPPAGSTKPANKVPFTDHQLADIIHACEELDDHRWGNRYGSGRWSGEDLKDFIWVSVFTGLRISDVVSFDIDRLHGSEVFLRAKKNGGEVFAHIPDWLRDRLTARAKKCGKQPFLIGGTKRLDTVIDTWRQQLAKVFELAEVGEDRPTPHRFRHTFARILLQRGVSVADVADLLGDQEKTVREHYARWVPERQARLTKILKDAFSDRPKLTAIHGGRA